jgi:hypothetical protein
MLFLQSGQECCGTLSGWIEHFFDDACKLFFGQRLEEQFADSLFADIVPGQQGTVPCAENDPVVTDENARVEG